MKFGKVLCGVTAALMALSTTAIVAQAEEAEQFKLQTVSASDVCGEDVFVYHLGANCLTDSKNNIYMFDDKSLEDWKKTGKADFKKLSCDTDLSGMEWWSGNFDEGYVQFAKRDSDNNVTERKVLHLDKATGTVKLAYTLPTDWCYTNLDGYTLTRTVNGKDISLIVYDPTGKKSSRSFTLLNDVDNWFLSATRGGEYVGYFMWKSSESTAEVYGGKVPVCGFELYGIKRNGELDLIHKSDRADIQEFGIYGCSENCVMWYEMTTVHAVLDELYSLENNKTYMLGAYGSYCGKIYDERVIIGVPADNTSNDMSYFLEKLNPNEEAEPISKQYKSMSTNDGKIYLVKTDDGKWGYIDINGKELAMFDDAGDFVGDYAPVVKNGKGYLIDRNMNKVSDEITADRVGTFSGELYRFSNGNKMTLATYAAAESKPDDTSSEPTSSEPTSSASTSSEPTSSVPVSSDTASSGTTGGNDNPNSGVAIALIPIALIGGAAVVVSKKRKR